jgi:uncharacterized protein YaeQ
MALKSTIFKAELAIADMDRHYYRDHALTLARHPSETDERLMVRLLAFALLAEERLEFGKGLSDTDEPDLWQKDLTGAVETWVEVGLPDERRIVRAAGRANRVVVVAYGGNAANIWWKGVETKLTRLSNLTVLNLPAEATEALAALTQRTMRLQVAIQEGHVMVTSDHGTVNLQPERWRQAAD